MENYQTPSCDDGKKVSVALMRKNFNLSGNSMAIELFFLRHGIAVESGTPGYTEETRELTKRESKKMILSTQGMKRMGLSLMSF